jgi:hypothetical protein
MLRVVFDVIVSTDFVSFAFKLDKVVLSSLGANHGKAVRFKSGGGSGVAGRLSAGIP